MTNRFKMMLYVFSFLCIYTLSQSSQLHALLDLEERIDKAVIETKQLLIPGYPDAFNPSIVRWKDRLLLCFRYRDHNCSTNPMAFAWLDEDFNVEGAVMPLLRFFEPCIHPSEGKDPRLVVVKDDLYVVYSNNVKLDDGENVRMILAKLTYTKCAFFAHSYKVMAYFQGEHVYRKEKNWVPFVYEDEILLSYTLNPHQVVLPPTENSQTATTVASTEKEINWMWGELRGGTNALKIGNHYLAFFHSVKSQQTVQSQGKWMPHYYMGAYLFDAHDPFEITHISKRPIVGPGFYNGEEYMTWKPLRVVFPGGFVFDQNYIFVVFGRQDHESWVVKLDRKILINNLTALESYADNN